MEEGSRRRRGSPAPAPARGRIRTVPIAVTPEGFWCCPSPAALQKSLKNPHHNHHKQPSPKQRSKVPSSSPPVPPPPKSPSAQQQTTAPSVSTDEAAAPADEHRNQAADVGAQHEQQQEEQHKICVGFGQPETSDLTVMLYGKEGVAVRMTVHRDVLCRSSVFFADKLGGGHGTPPPCCLEIHDCDDAEIYVETVGLMYCYDDEAKHKLLKQSVPRVLRIMKVAESLGFHACVKSCLDYLEAVPWVGEEEEDEVVSSIRHLRRRTEAYAVSPVLKRVQAAAPSSSVDNLQTASSSSPGRDTLARVVEMVLTSTDDRGRRDMKALVLNLFKDVDVDDGDGAGAGRTCSEMLYRSCRGCLDRLEEALFAEAASSSSPGDDELSTVDVITLHRRISLETDNLLWLVEILAHRRICDEFVAMWARRTGLAELHSKLPPASRRHAAMSRVTARLFVGIGTGEVLVPSATARLLLLRVWLPPLIDDYSCLLLQSSSFEFDRRTVDDGIGQTILTLPLEHQQSELLDWLGSFLTLGDRNCPNLHRAFQVWWRRTFVRPAYVSTHAQAGNGDALSIVR